MIVFRLGALVLSVASVAAATWVVACGAEEDEGPGTPEAGAGGAATGGAATGGAPSGGAPTGGAATGGRSGSPGGGASTSSGGTAAPSPDGGSALPCSEQGGSCTGEGEACCADLVCVAWKNPPRSGCEKACKGPGDCATGCCLPLANSSTAFCAAATACQCAPLDATCGGTARCCGGLECTSFDATGAFACKPACKENRDCASGCCAPLAGTSTSVCLGKEWCGK